MGRKTVYIAGPITGVPEHYKPFEQAMDEIQAMGFIPLNPCWQPEGLDRWKYMKLGLTMLECADAVLFLPGWNRSGGCDLELTYCMNTGKPYVVASHKVELPDAYRQLKEVLSDDRT